MTRSWALLALLSALACAAPNGPREADTPRRTPPIDSATPVPRSRLCDSSDPTLTLVRFAELPRELSPGARHSEMTGDGFGGFWLLGHCFTLSVQESAGVVTRVTAESVISEDDYEIDEATFQAQRAAGASMIDALTRKLGSPLFSHDGPTTLPSANELVNGPPPEPMCALWRLEQSELLVSSSVDIGKGIVDLRLGYEHKADAQPWSITPCSARDDSDTHIE